MLTIIGSDNSKTLKVDCVNKLCCKTFTFNGWTLGWTVWIALQSKGLFKSLLQHHSSKASVYGMMDSRPRKTGLESWFYYLLAVDLGQDSVPL